MSYKVNIIMNIAGILIFKYKKQKIKPTKTCIIWIKPKYMKQAGAELGQAQPKLGLGITLFFLRFCYSRIGLVDLVF